MRIDSLCSIISFSKLPSLGSTVSHSASSRTFLFLTGGRALSMALVARERESARRGTSWVGRGAAAEAVALADEGMRSVKRGED